METKAKILNGGNAIELEKKINQYLKKGYKIKGDIIYNVGDLMILVAK